MPDYRKMRIQVRALINIGGDDFYVTSFSKWKKCDLKDDPGKSRKAHKK